jgi:5'-methylthioinosine phosphorylase
MLAIIGGTGLTNLANLEITRREIIRTPYGEPSGPLTFGKIGAAEVVFLARHGYGHTIAPHEVNYCANVWALHSVGVSRVLAINSVGGIAANMAPGELAVPDQIIDYTYGRRHTFFEGADSKVFHVDFTYPYDESARQLYLAAAKDVGVSVHNGGVYGASQGPRLETLAEINRFERDGCAMVGMTGMPEAALAREKKLSFAVLALSMNHAAGRGSSATQIKLDDAEVVLREGMKKVMLVLGRAVELQK